MSHQQPEQRPATSDSWPWS